jgi:hypothetical protein
LPEEEGKEPLFEKWVKGHFDTMLYSLPFGRFAVYDAFFVLRYGMWPLWEDLVIDFREVQGARVKAGAYARIEYSKRGAMPNVCIRSSNPANLVALIEERIESAKAEDRGEDA